MNSKKTFLALVIISMLAVLTLPSFAWVYHDNLVEDGIEEEFGPRADRLLIKLYADDVAEFSALENHDIDLTDWPISKTYFDKWQDPPYSDYIRIANYGPEFGLFILDMNSNPNQYKGNPPNVVPGDPEWDYEATIGWPNPMSDVWLRRAIAYLVNRAAYLADPTIGAGFGFPMYTTMPAAMPKYLLDVASDPTIPWSYTYSPIAANATLDAHGFATLDGEGWRKWDTTGETVDLIFYIRSDHPGRNMIGTALVNELTNAGIKVTTIFGDSSVCSGPVMYQKEFHLYTGGWSLGVNPDHLILWSWNYYWHPGFCYDYGGHQDPLFDAAADGIMYANTQAEAVDFAMVAQYQQAFNVLGIPLYCVSGNKAWHKTYVGNEFDGELDYYGANWRGIKNRMGYGIDNGYTLSNMVPENAVEGNGNMTIRWGFKSSEIKQLNPIYASWLFDWNVMSYLYPSLLGLDVDDPSSYVAGVAKDWFVSSYMNQDGEECSKIRFQLRDDVYWSDGVKLTVDDVYFTFVQLKEILNGRGLPNPWWWSNVQNIKSFSFIDDCTFEVLLDVKSYWALGWVGGNVLLPKHVWEPIATSGDPEAAIPDPTVTGATGWKFVSYTGIGGTVLLAKNPLYYNIEPVDTKVMAKGTIISPQRIKPCTPPADAWFEVSTVSYYELSNIIVDKEIWFTNETDGYTETLVRIVPGIVLEPDVPDVEIVTLNDIATALGIPLDCWPRGYYDIDVRVHIVGPASIPVLPNPWISHWKEVKFDWVGTMAEDINTDLYVNAKDAVKLGTAFGAQQGTSTWNAKCDINGDGYVNAKDAVKLGTLFGWPY